MFVFVSRGLFPIFFACAAYGETSALTFEDHVRPILRANCVECHGEAPKLKGGLDVRLTHLLRSGGESGPAVVPGKPDEGTLLDMITSKEMPPGKKKLTPKDVDTIRRWVEQGAKNIRAEPAKLAPGFYITKEEETFWSFQPIQNPTPPAVKDRQQVRTPIDAFVLAALEAKGLHFNPEADRRVLIRRAYFDLLGLPPTPQEVDAFVADSSPQAYEKVLDRLLASPHYGERWGRHWLDVAGYSDSEGATGEDPPRTSAWRYRDYVIRAFNADMSWEQFIREQIAGDELVSPPFPYEKASPGDKAAMTKLMADARKVGFKTSVQAVNARDGEKIEKLIATGFLRMAPDGSASKDVVIPTEANQTIADTIQIVSTAFLGLTVHCAQCHNHKYDPISQADYFRLRAIFEPAFNWNAWRAPRVREVVILDEDSVRKAGELEAAAKKLEKERSERLKEWIAERFEKEIGAVPADDQANVREIFFKRATDRKPDEVQVLRNYPTIDKIPQVVAPEFIAKYTAEAREIASLRAKMPATDSIRPLTEIPDKVPETRLFERGDYLSPKEQIAPGTLTVLARHGMNEIPAKSPSLATTGRRLAFAEWLTHPGNPLTSRVLVNRFWLHHFGQALVANPADFGALGEKPTHPELLDWLAHDFQAGGWKLKRLHKTIMMSAVYRQGSVRGSEQDRVDPDNKLLGRMPVRRLDAETVRDALLSLSGKLNPKQFGPPIPVTPDEQGEVIVGVDTRDGAGRPSGKIVPMHGEEFRRSTYILVKRTSPLSMLETFDGPMLSPNCECRVPTTVATQALLLMNNREVVTQSGLFAARIQKQAGGNLREQITLAWAYAMSQQPSQEDLDAAGTFLTAQAKTYEKRGKLPAGQSPDQLALADYCHALIGSNAFLYVE